MVLGGVLRVNETIPYGLGMRHELYARNPKTVKYGPETITFLSPNIWALLSQYKRFLRLDMFKNSIRKPDCSCC